MERVRLGRTDLEVSPAGLGCGGYSRLGMRDGGTPAAKAVITAALDLGINYFDTARAYGTEEVVGEMVRGIREEVVISTKTMFRGREDYLPAAKLVESLDKSIKRMNTDYVDIFSFHGVTPEHLDYCVNEFVPVLQREMGKGKVRHLGITESFMHDPTHEMLKAAIPTNYFDVVMVGFNFLNPGARDEVFPACLEHEVGTQVMHAVRRALSNPDVLGETVRRLLDSGEISAERVDAENPLGFLASHAEVRSVVEAAYRFCRHEPGVSVVLTGTGSAAHLADNVAALTAPPLPEEIRVRLDQMFGGVRSISGD